MKLRRASLERLEARELLAVTPELLLDIYPGVKTSNMQELVEFNGEVYFRADDGSHGVELWKTDGTATGTVLVKDINPGKDSSTPGWFTNYNGALYFSAVDSQGDELWKTDGTTEGTVRVIDLESGSAGSFPSELTVFNGELYFSASAGRFGSELWKSDGTPDGTVLVRDINPDGNADPGGFSGFHVFGDAIYFSARGPATGIEMWKSDGTAAGTQLVIDVDPGNASSFPFQFIEFANNLYFLAEQFDSNNNTFDNFLFRIDGTTGEATRAVDVAVAWRRGIFPYKDHLYFAGVGSATGTELYRTDGTEAGTELFKDVFVGEPDSNPEGFFEFGGNLYFAAADTQEEGNDRIIPRLWRTDGNPVTTFRVSDDEVELTAGVVVYHDEAYFSAIGPAGFELYKIEASFAARPVLVKDILPGAASSAPRPLAVLDDRLYFIAEGERTGVEIWSTDGTEAGTAIVKDIFLGGEDFSLEPTRFEFFKFGNDLLFIAGSPFVGHEPWIIRGSATVTPQVLPGDVNGDGEVRFDDFLVLSANFGKAEDATLADGDFDGDGRVLFPDFLILAANFGKTLAAQPAAASSEMRKIAPFVDDIFAETDGPAGNVPAS